MSNVEACPEIGDLLNTVDGEASPDTHQLVVRHLQACPLCRDRLRTIEQTVAMGRTYHALSPEADAARAVRFRRRLQAECQAERRRQDRWRRLVAPAAVVTAAVVGILLVRPPSVVVVRAEDLLARAVAIEQQTPGTAQRIRVTVAPAAWRASSSTPVAPVWMVREVNSGRIDETSDTRVAQVTTGLARAGVDVHRLLSAAAFGAWRAGVHGRRDRVTETGDLLVLRTTAPTGRIRLAELMLGRTSYRVTGQAWLIEGTGRVEIQSLRQPDSLVATAAGSRLDRDGGVRPSAAAAAHGDKLDHLELDARLAVSRVDPDGHVEIARRGSRVLVTGAVASAAKRRAITARLMSWPGIDVKLRATRALPAKARDEELERWADRTFGQGSARQAFPVSLRIAATTIDRRVAGLDALARRYPVDVARVLSPSARGKLQALVAREYRALTADLLVLDARLMLLGSQAETLVLPPTAPPADWRERIANATAKTAALDAAIGQLLAQDDRLDGTAARAAFGSVWGLVVGPR